MNPDEIRKKKLESLEKQFEEQQQLQQQVVQIEETAKQYMTKDALERFGNIKQAHPEKAVQVAIAIVQGVQSGQVHQKITGDMLKEMLMHLQPEKRKTLIRRM